MKKNIIRITALFLLMLQGVTKANAQQASNPVIFADVPDMSMIRVGKTII